MAKRTESATPPKHKTTFRLLKNLLNSKDFSEFLENNSEDMTECSFAEYFEQLCNESEHSKSDIIRLSGIERTYGYQIARGDRKPTRDKAIQLAIGLSLDVNGTQKLLRYAQKSELYPRIKRDAAIIFCIDRHMGFSEIQSFLSDLGEEPLSSGDKSTQ